MQIKISGVDWDKLFQKLMGFIRQPVVLFVLATLATWVFLDGLSINGWLWVLAVIAIFVLVVLTGFSLEDENMELLGACIGIFFGFILSCWSGEWGINHQGATYLDTENQQIIIIPESGIQHLPNSYMSMSVKNRIFTSYEVDVEGFLVEYDIDTSYTWLNLDFLAKNADNFLVYDVDSYEVDAIISLHKEGKLNQKNAEQRLCDVLGHKGFDITECKLEFGEIEITEKSTSVTTK